MSSDIISSISSSVASGGVSVSSAGGTASPAEAGNTAAKVGTDLPPVGQSASSDNQGLHSAVRRLNDFVQNEQRALEFSIDQQSGRTVIKVIDLKNKEVIRQIPPKEALQMADNLAAMQHGTILKAKA